MKLQTTRPSEGGLISLRDNLSLMDGLLRAARERFAASHKILAELPADLQTHDATRAPAVTVADMMAQVRAMDDIADRLQIESKQIWASVEYISGNVHKVAFGKQVEPSHTTIDDRVRQLPQLAIRLAEMVSLLERAVADLISRQRR